jgi:hypothetical protein
MFVLSSNLTTSIRPDSEHRFGSWLRGMQLGVLLLSLVGVSAVCVSAGGGVEFIEDSTPVTDDLTIVIEAARADVELYPGEAGTVITRIEAGNQPKVVHRVRPGGILPTSRLLIETFIPIEYAPRSRAIVRMWIPDGAEIEVNGEDVSVSIRGPIAGTIEVSGQITLTKGDVTLTDVIGDFEINTDLGGITLNRVDGEVDAETGRGSIFFRGAASPSEISHLETGTGSIFADLSRTPEIPVSAEAERGAILVHDGKNPLSGSHISVVPDDGVASLELVTGNGIIDIRR